MRLWGAGRSKFALLAALLAVVLQLSSEPESEEDALSLLQLRSYSDDTARLISAPSHIEVHELAFLTQPNATVESEDACPKIPFPADSACSAACPYTQLLAGAPCKKLCVTSAMCQHTHPARVFADNRTMACEPACGDDMKDRLVGCEVCAGRGVCEKCAALFELTEKGTCKATWDGPVNWLYGGLGVVVVMIVVCVVMLWRRKPTNQQIVARGLEYRANQVPRFNGADLPLWQINLRQNQDISGIGTSLYFRALVFVGFLVLVVLVVERLVPAGASLESCEAANNKPIPGGGPDALYARTMSWSLLLVYLLVVGIICNFSHHQRVGHHVNMAAFAVEVGNLPETVEAELEDVAVWGVDQGDLVGVSLAFDYTSKIWEMQVATMIFPEEPEMPMYWEAGEPDSNPPQDAPSCRALLESLRSTGTAIAVFRTVAAAQTALAHGCRVGGTVYDTRAVPAEPEGVRWQDFQRALPTWDKYAKGAALLVMTVVAWSILYVPYAVTYMRSSRIPGLRPDMLMDLILGVLIAVGNLCVTMAVEAAVDMLQMRYKPIRDVAVLRMCVWFLLLNTTADVAMTVVLAQGMSLDDAFSKPVGEHAGYSRVLARELLALIMPGYLVVPYLVEPIFTITVPKLIGTVVARTDTRVKEPLARAWLHASPVELSWRYADLVNNLCICWLVLFLSSPNAWKAQAYYILFLCLIASIDRYNILRVSRAWHTSRCLHQNFCFLLVIPCTVLALAVLFWLRQASFYVHEMNPKLVYFIGLLTHFMFYSAALRFSLRGSAEPSSETYDDVLARHESHGRPGTYFNLNPIYELRRRAGKS